MFFFIYFSSPLRNVLRKKDFLMKNILSISFLFSSLLAWHNKDPLFKQNCYYNFAPNTNPRPTRPVLDSVSGLRLEKKNPNNTHQHI